MGRVNKNTEIVEDVSKRSQRRKNSSPYFDFDLDEVWTPNNPHLKHFKNASDKNKKNKTKMQLYGSNQSLRRSLENIAKEDIDEFDTEAEIFKDRDNAHATQAVLQDIAKLSDNFESVALRDAYGRELRRRDSLDSTFMPEDSSISLGNSLNSSPLSTMSKIHLSNTSSASSSSRKSSQEGLPNGSRHSRRSMSSNSDLPNPTRLRSRQLSASSLLSSGSRSPGMPRKVSNSANMLTTGLAVEKHRKNGSRAGSRGHSPSRVST